jgi:hypothetical protein
VLKGEKKALATIFLTHPVVNFGHCLENSRSKANFWLLFPLYVLILTNNLLGCTLGDFFTNSSGHPVRNEPISSDGGKRRET